jgi:MFS family permease
MLHKSIELKMNKKTENNLLKNVTTFYYFNFFSCFRPHWPIAIIYYAQVSDSYTLAAAVFSTIFLAQALLEVPTGYLSDLIGRRKVLFLGGLSAASGVLLYAVAFNFWFLFIGAIFEGLSRSLFSGTQRALLFESLKQAKSQELFEKALGKTSSVEQVALAASAACGGVMLFFFSMDIVFWIAVLPQVLCMLSALFFKEPEHVKELSSSMVKHVSSSIRLIWSNRKLRLISLSEVLDFGFGEALFYFQAAFYKMLIPDWLIGFVRSLNHTFSALGFWFSGWAIDKFGHRTTLVGGSVISTLIQYVAVLIPTVASPFMVASVSLFFGPADTARGGLMHREFSDNQRATMDSMISLTSSLFFSMFSLTLGFLADVTSPSIAMLAGISSNIIVIYIYMKVFKKKGL